jgi:hypothetical protein
VWADPLPNVKIEPQWLQCSVASDCGLVRDACRSCGEPVALNKQFIAAYLERDYQQRAAADIMIACEACSQVNVVVSCELQQCKAKRENP